MSIINGIQHYTFPICNKSIWYYSSDNNVSILHREDGPAVENSNGKKIWVLHNQQHRLDGPAIERNSLRKEWYVNGQLHRTDGPAIEYNALRKEWWICGKLHREDGPAIIREDGSLSYFQYGVLHREDGPAETVNTDYNSDKYWFCGVRYSYQDYCQLIKV